MASKSRKQLNQEKQDKQHQLEELKNQRIIQNDKGSLIVINAEQVEVANKIFPRLDMDYMHNFYSIGYNHEIDLSKLANKRIEMRKKSVLLWNVLIAIAFGLVPLLYILKFARDMFGSTGMLSLFTIIVASGIGWVFYEWRNSVGKGKVIDKNLGLYWEGNMSNTNVDSNRRENTVNLKEVKLIQLAKTDLDESVHYELNFVFSDGSRYNFLRFGNLLDAKCVMYLIAKLLNVNIVAKSELLV